MQLSVPSIQYQKAWLSFYLNRTALALGWVGIVSLILAMLSIVVYFSWMASLQDQSQTLFAKIHEQQLLPRNTSQNTIEALESNPTQAQDDAQLPSEVQAEGNLHSLLQLAQRHRLSLVSGQYQWKSNAASNTHVAVYRLTLPLEGHYLAFRQFLHAAYLALPHLALTELTIQREQRDQETLAIQTVWEFYFDASINPNTIGPHSKPLAMSEAKVAIQ